MYTHSQPWFWRSLVRLFFSLLITFSIESICKRSWQNIIQMKMGHYWFIQWI
jgi:hypothetical protein